MISHAVMDFAETPSAVPAAPALIGSAVNTVISIRSDSKSDVACVIRFFIDTSLSF